MFLLFNSNKKYTNVINPLSHLTLFYLFSKKGGGKSEKHNCLFQISLPPFLNQLTTLCKFVEISFTIIFEISTMFFFLVRDQCFHTKRFARFRTYHIYHCWQSANGLFTIRSPVISQAPPVNGIQNNGDIPFRISPVFYGSRRLRLYFPNQLTDNSFFWSSKFINCSLCTSICAFTSRRFVFQRTIQFIIKWIFHKTILLVIKKPFPEKAESCGISGMTKIDICLTNWCKKLNLIIYKFLIESK